MRVRTAVTATVLAAVAVLGAATTAAAVGPDGGVGHHDDDNVVINKQTWSPNTITDNFNRSFNSASSFGDMVLD